MNKFFDYKIDRGKRGLGEIRSHNLVWEKLYLSENSVRFWHDRWCEAGVLKRVFPRLYSISLQKNFLINQMGDWHEGVWNWHLTWRRILYDWENDEVTNLKIHIEQQRPNREMEDSVIWKQSGSMGYPVKSIVTKMNESYAPTLPKPVIDIVWQKYIPPRAQVHVWLANLEKLKIGDFLVERGIIDYQQALCPFCNLEVESNTHILLTCRLSWRC